MILIWKIISIIYMKLDQNTENDQGIQTTQEDLNDEYFL